MAAELVLTSAIWNKDLSRSMINQALKDQAIVLERHLKRNIDNSTPAGRLYSRKAEARSRKRIGSTSNAYKRRNLEGRRVTSTTTFYQASAPGQPPARVTSLLYNSIRVRREVGAFRLLASVTAPAVDILDDPSKLNRPFFYSVIFADDGDWNFRQSVRLLLSRMINKDINAIRAPKVRAARALAKAKESAARAQKRSSLGVYKPPSA